MEEQVETAAVLCLVYSKFIKVHSGHPSQHFSLLTNVRSGVKRRRLYKIASLRGFYWPTLQHEVRTPLNSIINYLEIALEGGLDQERRDNLATSHSASKSLVNVINDLLDLTKTEEGQELIKDGVFDLPGTVHEATDSFKRDAKRKVLEYEVVEHPGCLNFVHGDQRRIRQAVANIIANAIQNTSSGWVRVEMFLQAVSDDKATVKIVMEGSGAGMSNDKLDSLFRELEQVTTDEDGMFDDSEQNNRQLAKRRTVAHWVWASQ
jgi:signal transduction histidine kinase